MPITGPASYGPTLNEFVLHWPRVNTELGAPLVLPSGVDLILLTAVRDQLSDFVQSVIGMSNDVEIARGQLEILKTEILARLGEFNRKVRGFLGHTAYVQALPEAPSMTSASPKIIEPLEDMANLWSKINSATISGFTGPLTLLGGFTLMNFTLKLGALKNAYFEMQNVTQSLSLERLRRTEVEKQAYQIMLDYRGAVIGSFPPDHPLVLDLPRLTPVGGSTPPRVTATAVWDPVAGMARITWTEIPISNLARFEIRFCFGSGYSTDVEELAGSVEPTEPREFLTLAALPNPGSTANYKVYGITTDGNESGSDAVSVTRPA